jgi:HK97 gp10 family phage protein
VGQLRATAKFTPNANLSALLPKVAGAVRASVEATLKVIQEAAKAACPVDTGALRDSITIQMEDSDTGTSGSVGPTMYYAEYVEYGTGRRGGPAPYAHVMSWPGQRPQPYMRPAFDGNQDAILDLFRGQISVVL